MRLRVAIATGSMRDSNGTPRCSIIVGTRSSVSTMAGQREPGLTPGPRTSNGTRAEES